MRGKYLVLGSSGLLGTGVLSRLKDVEGVDVVSVFHSHSPKIDANNIVHKRLDLRKRSDCMEAMQGIDYVLHMASSVVLYTMSEAEIAERVLSNMSINSQILEFAHRKGVKKLLWISSTTAYPSKEYLVEDDIFEGDPPDKYFVVGCMTRFVEKLCIFYSQKVKTPISISVLRPTCIYGENEGFDETCHILPYIVRKILDGDSIQVWDDGEAKRDYVYVDDAVEACFIALGCPGPFEAFNVGYGAGYSANDIIEMVCDLEGIDELDVRRQSSKQKSRVLSTAKIKNIGFVPSVNMLDGVSRLIKEYKCLQYRS